MSLNDSYIEKQKMEREENRKNMKTFILIAIIASVSGYLAASSMYSLSGKAELKQAEWNRQISIREAEAKRDAAKMLAEAEIERAKGVAEANKIIGDSLKGNSEYLRYLWIENLQKDQNKVIYVPTEAGMPILEAGKR